MEVVTFAVVDVMAAEIAAVTAAAARAAVRLSSWVSVTTVPVVSTNAAAVTKDLTVVLSITADVVDAMAVVTVDTVVDIMAITEVDT